MSLCLSEFLSCLTFVLPYPLLYPQGSGVVLSPFTLEWSWIGETCTICLFACLSVCLSVCVSVCLFVGLASGLHQIPVCFVFSVPTLLSLPGGFQIPIFGSVRSVSLDGSLEMVFVFVMSLDRSLGIFAPHPPLTSLLSVVLNDWIRSVHSPSSICLRFDPHTQQQQQQVQYSPHKQSQEERH